MKPFVFFCFSCAASAAIQPFHIHCTSFAGQTQRTNHVHVEHAVLVQLVDDSLGGHTDSRDEELRARVNDDVDQFVELALGVVVAAQKEAESAHDTLHSKKEQPVASTTALNRIGQPNTSIASPVIIRPPNTTSSNMSPKTSPSP